MPDDSDLLTEYELADLLRVKVQVVRRLRMSGEPPSYLRVGKHVRYPRTAITQFLAGAGTNHENDTESATA
jgi:excisionase family DNA binding protein